MFKITLKITDIYDNIIKQALFISRRFLRDLTAPKWKQF